MGEGAVAHVLEHMGGVDEPARRIPGRALVAHGHELHGVPVHHHRRQAVTADAAHGPGALRQFGAGIVRTAGAEIGRANGIAAQGLGALFQLGVDGVVGRDLRIFDAQLVEQGFDGVACPAHAQLADRRQ